MSSQTIVSNNLFNKKKQFMRLCAIAMVEEGVLKEREQHLLDQIYKEIFKDVDDSDIIKSLKGDFPNAGDSPSLLYSSLLCSDQSMCSSMFMNTEALTANELKRELKYTMQIINADDSVTDREREAFRIICKLFKIRHSRKLWNTLYNLSPDQIESTDFEILQKQRVDINDFKTISKAIKFYHIQGPIIGGIYHVLQRELTFEREHIFRNDKRWYKRALIGFCFTAALLYLFVSFHTSLHECQIAAVHTIVEILLMLFIPAMMIAIEWLIFMLDEYALKRSHKRHRVEGCNQTQKEAEQHGNAVLTILVVATIIADVCVGIIELNGELTAANITAKCVSALFLGCVCFFIGKFIHMHRVHKSIDVDDMGEVVHTIEEHIRMTKK
ncbi:MAG: hypothetical protein II262_01545 [Alistipes sp.]|nr:hypothetical protein [Alistipes sp.]